MKNTMKKVLCTVLIIVICLTSAPLGGFVVLDFTAKAAEYQVGDIIEFGSYPQSEVKDETLIAELNARAPEWGDWVSCGYYSGTGEVGSMVQGDWMRYTDVTFEGERYRGVKFTQYRPLFTYNYIDQKSNGYFTDIVYWFKFETLKWEITDLTTGQVISNSLIDAQAFNNTVYRNDDIYAEEQAYAYFGDSMYTYYANNYEKSSVRSWLNNEFYNLAFSETGKEEIVNTEITNIATDDKFTCGTTYDKIYLLNLSEAEKYGYISPTGMGTSKGLCVTDYTYCVRGYCDEVWFLRQNGYNSYSSYLVSGDRAFAVGVDYISNIRPVFSFGDASKIHSHTYEITYSKHNTCQDGKVVYTCNCGATYRELLEEKHNCISEITDEATHLKEGKKTYTCLLCDYSYVETIPKTPEHFYEESTVTPPTCTSQGYTTYACKCGDTYTDNYVDTIDHTYTESIISQPTCNTVGKKQFYCTTCHTYKYETIPTNDEHIDNDNNGYCDRCKVLFAYTEGYYHYTVKDEKATIIDIDNSISGDVVIPSTLGGYPVVAIGDEAFAESFNITSVVIPEGVTYIDEDAFALCFRMESVTLPESLETIENWVFGACLSLKEIVLPESVVNINDSAFDSCLSLEKIVIKNAEASIGEYICYTTLLPKDITTSEWVEKYITAYEAMLNGDENAETLMAELESHTTILEDEAAVLPELTIYSHDPSIAKTYAEENGIKFEEITDIPTSGTCGNNSTWSFDSETGELVISGSGTAGLERDDNGNYIIPWESLKLNIKSLVVENGIEGIGGFENCVNLKVVTLADSIIVFGDEAFRNCSSLEEIKLPQSLTMIGAAAFCDCTSLKEVVIPDTVEYIYPGAFVKCFNLESVKLPSYLTCIEDDVFNYCYKLKHLEIPETVTKIDGKPFVCCVSLKEISIPAGVTTIEPAAFENCWALEDIYIYSEQLGLDNSLLGEISAYKGIEEYYGSTNKDQNITSYINVSLKYLSGDADVQETIEGIVDCIQKYEKPIYSETLTIHGYAGSNAETYANKNGIKFEVINENTTIADSNTGVEIEYDNSAFECEVELVVSEEEINANIVFGDEFESYKAYDISLVADGEKVQPNGYVTVKLPIPEGFNAETTVVYYVDDSGNKTKLESTTENGYIVFETNHFSEYVLVDESSRIEPPHVHSYTASITKEATCTENGTTTYTCSCGDSYNETIEATGHDFDGSKCKNCDYDKADTCDCNCHKGGFMGFIWKIINFFNKLFKSKQYCACGAKHY